MKLAKTTIILLFVIKLSWQANNYSKQLRTDCGGFFICSHRRGEHEARTKTYISASPFHTYTRKKCYSVQGVTVFFMCIFILCLCSLENFPWIMGTICSLDIDGLDWFFIIIIIFIYNSRILLMGLDWLMRRWNQDKGWHFFCHACCWLALCTYIDWLRCIQEKLATSWNLENSQFDSWFFFYFFSE